MKNTWLLIQKVTPNLNQTEEIVPTATEKPLSKLEEYLRTKEINVSSNSVNGTHSIDRKIESLCHGDRLNADTSTLQYWESKKLEDGELYLLSQTVLGVPATQVSVERAFSALALVLTKQRTSLTEENLNNILVVKLNADILKNINCTD